MKNLLAIFILGATLAGCAAAPPPVVLPKTVEVPVYKKEPAPVLPARPDSTVKTLKHGDPADVVVKAYRADIEALKGYSKALEVLLSGYGGKTTDAVSAAQ